MLSFGSHTATPAATVAVAALMKGRPQGRPLPSVSADYVTGQVTCELVTLAPVLLRCRGSATGSATRCPARCRGTASPQPRTTPAPPLSVAAGSVPGRVCSTPTAPG